MEKSVALRRQRSNGRQLPPPRFIQFGQPPRPKNQKFLPERYRSKHILEKAPYQDGYLLKLSCGHGDFWVPVDPGEQWYCGPCLIETLERDRATFTGLLGFIRRARQITCAWESLILRQRGGDVQ
jgi:hypothetical protein